MLLNLKLLLAAVFEFLLYVALPSFEHWLLFCFISLADRNSFSVRPTLFCLYLGSHSHTSFYHDLLLVLCYLAQKTAFHRRGHWCFCYYMSPSFEPGARLLCVPFIGSFFLMFCMFEQISTLLLIT